MCQRSGGLIQSAEWFKTQYSSFCGCFARQGTETRQDERSPESSNRSHSALWCWVTAVTITSSLFCLNNAADSDSPPPAIIAFVALFHISPCNVFLNPSACQHYILISLVSRHHLPIYLNSAITASNAELQASLQLDSRPPDGIYESEPPICFWLILVILTLLLCNEFPVRAWSHTREKLGASRAQPILFICNYRLCVSWKQISYCWY